MVIFLEQNKPKLASAPDHKTTPKEATRTRTQPSWKVVLFNDEEHTYDYVVELLTTVCKLSKDAAFSCALEVDMTGRTIVYFGTKEGCEKICAQILTYGPDHRLPHSMHSMQAEVQS